MANRLDDWTGAKRIVSQLEPAPVLPAEWKKRFDMQLKLQVT